MSQPTVIRDEKQATKLWIHEVCRVFHDRLINDVDRNWFYDLMMELLGRYFKTRFEKEDIFGQDENHIILFSDL